MTADPECYLKATLSSHAEIPFGAFMLQRIQKFFGRTLWRRIKYLQTLIMRAAGLRARRLPLPEDLDLKVGELVRVKTKEQIYETLDFKNRLGKLTFDEGMWKFCGTTRRVFKVVNKIMNDTRWIMMKTAKSVILENVTCDGKMPIGICDRSCYYFWRTEWLEKIEDNEQIS
jgi:hypothetical protein